jgi:iron complex transport system ATP-binding protein
MSVLSCTDLSVAIAARPVLSGVDLTLSAGQVTAVVGPNGAGKSTLLACLGGLRTPTTGFASLGETRLLDLPPRERAQRLAFLPQTPEIAWAVEARTLIELGRIPFTGARGLSVEDRAAVDRAMAAAHVEAFEHRIVDTLSGGERARVLIARALAGEPEWLLADEPLTGLDPAHQLDAADLFRDLASKGAGVVVTLHDLSLALRTADRVIVLADGGVLSDGPPASALTPDILRRAYGVEAAVTSGPGGPLIDVLGRS